MMMNDSTQVKPTVAGTRAVTRLPVIASLSRP